MTAGTATTRDTLPLSRATNAPTDPATAERAAFYAALWGDDTGVAYIVGGLPGSEIAALGWPLGAGETNDPDRVLLLTWTRETFDTFKAAGRPHTGKVFAWPREARALDRYVTKLDAEGYNVYTRKYLGADASAAKHGEAPATASVVMVEDAPADPAPLAPPYSFTLQTSDYSRHAFYRLARPLPWAQVYALAEAAGLRLDADHGGQNAAQFTRVPTTRNTKRKANRFRVRYAVGAGPIEPAELAHAVGLDLHRTSSAGAPGERHASNGKGGPGADDAAWCAAVEASEGWRGYVWKDGALWKGGPVLREDGSIRAARDPQATINRVLRGEITWAEGAAQWGGKDPSGSGFTYHLVGVLWRAGCELPQLIAMVEALDQEARRKGDGWFYHQNLWGCLYRPHKGWALLEPNIPRRPLRNFTPRPAELPAALQRRGRGRPVGAKDAHMEALADLLAQRRGEQVTRAALAEALRVTPRTVTTHLRTLTAAGRLDLMPTARGFIVVRVENKSAPPQAPGSTDIPPSSAEECPEGWIINPPAEGGNYAGFSASQSGADPQEDHTPPPAPCVARAAAPAVAPPAEDVQIARPGAPLVDVCRAALRLAVAGDVPLMKQRGFVRALVDAERPGTGAEAFHDAYAAARDFCRLEQKPTKALEKELQKRKRHQARAQREATQVPGGPVPCERAVKLAWAAGFATRRAGAVLWQRTGKPTPADDGTEGRAGAVELAQLGALGSNALAAERIRRKLRGQLPATAVYGPRWARGGQTTPRVSLQPTPIAPPALVETLPFGQAGAEVRRALFDRLRAKQDPAVAPAAACT